MSQHKKSIDILKDFVDTSQGSSIESKTALAQFYILSALLEIRDLLNKNE